MIKAPWYCTMHGTVPGIILDIMKGYGNKNGETYRSLRSEQNVDLNSFLKTHGSVSVNVCLIKIT